MFGSKKRSLLRIGRNIKRKAKKVNSSYAHFENYINVSSSNEEMHDSKDPNWTLLETIFEKKLNSKMNESSLRSNQMLQKTKMN